MAKLVRLDAIRTRVLQCANMESSTFMGTSELNGLINMANGEFHDALIEAAPPDYFSTDSTISTVSGTISYALPSDFRSLQKVFVQGSSSDRLRPLKQLTDSGRARYQAPQGAYTVIVRYTPAPVTLTADGDTIDEVGGGWSELLVAIAARDCLIKARRDIGEVNLKIQELRSRIASHARKRNQSGPRYVTNVDEEAEPRSLYFQDYLSGWQLRGGYLDLFSPDFQGWWA